MMYFWCKIREDLHKKIIDTVSKWALVKKPFLLIVDFDAAKPLLFSLDELEQEDISLNFPDYKTGKRVIEKNKAIVLDKKPLFYADYKNAFNKVLAELKHGNSFLTNLTVSTQIKTNASLQSIYQQAKAKYKILFKNEWLCFSPETFITIDDKGFIKSNPMKGTIDASIKNAKEIILNDVKEKAEHYTIVDLIRNDLSAVATHVQVKRFRYIDAIKTEDKTLLQVSSEIEGQLPENFKSNLGEILFQLLPAGSISGAPKKKTIEIIKAAETHQRNYYTGVAFLYNGHALDSCVLIRFIEKTKTGLVYKSGGGITINSDCAKEYKELIDKVYVPVN